MALPRTMTCGKRMAFHAWTSFTELTGEYTEDLPAGLTIDDPAIISWLDADGNLLDDAEAHGLLSPVSLDRDRDTLRNSTVAARLKAIYGDVDNVDAFIGMVSEGHVDDASFGPLQLAIWQEQFANLRDGDRFFLCKHVQRFDLRADRRWHFSSSGDRASAKPAGYYCRQYRCHL